MMSGDIIEYHHSSSGLFNMGIPHITHIKLLWGKK